MKDKIRIIQELYYGNISPGEQSIIAGSEYSKVSNLTNRLYNQLTEKLNNDEVHLLNKLIDAQMELNRIVQWRISVMDSIWE